MIIFFTEKDMIMFGNYMISEVREQNIRNNQIPGESIEDKLKQVNNEDIAHWSHLMNKANQEQRNNEG